MTEVTIPLGTFFKGDVPEDRPPWKTLELLLDPYAYLRGSDEMMTDHRMRRAIAIGDWLREHPQVKHHFQWHFPSTVWYVQYDVSMDLTDATWLKLAVEGV
jgi:hypothetical protein